jgi:hypothetical protein
MGDHLRQVYAQFIFNNYTENNKLHDMQGMRHEKNITDHQSPGGSEKREKTVGGDHRHF